MKNKLSGYVEKKINGKKVAFKFGTNAFALLSELHGVDLDKIDTVLSNVTGVRDLIYCAAKAACLSSGVDVSFNQYTVGDWLDEMEQSDYNDILDALNGAKVLGNSLDSGEEKKV